MAQTEMDILVRARDQASGTLRRIGGSVNSTTGRFSKLGSTLGTVARRGFLAIGAGATAAVYGIKKSIDSASDLNESVSKVGVVFGDSSKDIMNWSKTSDTAMGISRQAALEAAGTFGNLFTAMKISRGPAVDMSKSIVELSSDLASFNNQNPEDVLLALRAGLVGEAEPLRKFGINISAAATAQEALRLGIAKTGDELTPAQKAQANYSLIMAQSTTAQGDFARTADGVANKQRIVSAQFENAKASLGQVFLPLWQAVLGGFSSAVTRLKPVITWVRNLVKGFTDGKGPLKDLTATIKNALGTALSNAWTIIKNVVEAFQDVWEWASRNRGILSDLAVVIGVVVAAYKVYVIWQKAVVLWQKAVVLWNKIIMATQPWMVIAVIVIAVIALIIKHWDAVKKWLLKLWNSLKSSAIQIWNGLKRAASAVWGAIKAVIMAPVRVVSAIVRAQFQVLKTVVMGVWNALKAGARLIWNGIKLVILGPVKAVKALLTAAWGFIKDKAIGTWNAIKGAILGVWDAIVGGIKVAINGLIGILNTAIRGINTLIHGYNKIPFAPNIGDIPSIPTLEHGGVVSRTGLALVHRGEVFSGVNRNYGPFGKGGRVDVFIDRRHWTRESAVETQYRGWG